MAGLNRHNDNKVILIQIDLTKKLIEALEKNSKVNHVIFSSSTRNQKIITRKIKIKIKSNIVNWATSNSKYY